MNKKKVLFIVLAVVLIGAIAAGVWFFLDHTPPEVKPLEGLVFTDKDTITPQMLVIATDEDSNLTFTSDLESLKLGDHVTGNFTVKVTVTDSSKNSASCDVSFGVEPFDKVSPEISGADDLYVLVGETVDLLEGVSVSDDIDNNPVLIVEPSEIDTSSVSSYEVKYTAKDAYGNETQKIRAVTIYAPEARFDANWDRTGLPGYPYLVAVNRACCCVTIYETDSNGRYTVPIKSMVCSIGMPNGTRSYETETPLGLFYTTDRYEWCYMVDGSWGRYAIRVTNDGIMFHSVCYYTQTIDDLEYGEYNKLGSPASLGCIRLCLSDIKWLYDNMPYGFPVIIYDDESSPGPLGKPDPIKIDENDERRGWDPTDPSSDNPWKN